MILLIKTIVSRVLATPPYISPLTNPKNKIWGGAVTRDTIEEKKERILLFMYDYSYLSLFQLGLSIGVTQSCQNSDEIHFTHIHVMGIDNNYKRNDIV